MSNSDFEAMFDRVATEDGGETPEVPAAPEEKPAKAKAEAKPEKPAKAQEKPAKAAPKAEAPKVAAPAEAKEKAADAAPLATVEAVTEAAKKLGLVVEDGRVMTAERASFRAEIQRGRTKLGQERAAAEHHLQAKLAEHNDVISWAYGLRDAVAADDLDSAAKYIDGSENWNAFQETRIKRLADPNYQKLRELEEKTRAAEQRQREADERRNTELTQREQAAAVAACHAEIAADATKSTDPVAQAFADDATFQRMVYARQVEFLDRETATTITVEQALDVPYGPPGTPTLRKQLEAVYARAQKAFPAAPQAQEPAGKPAVSAPAAATLERTGKPKPLSASKPREPEAPKTKKKNGDANDLIKAWVSADWD